MQNILFLLTGVVIWLGVMLCWKFYGVLELPFLDSQIAKWFHLSDGVPGTEEKEYCLRGKKSLFPIILSAVLLLVFSYYIGTMETGIFTKWKLVLLLFLMFSVALIDARRRIIPNRLVAFTIIVRLLLGIGEWIQDKEHFQMVLILDVLGFAFGFGVLLIVAVLSRQALGYGDVKLFAAIGITLGIAGTYNTLFYGMIYTLVAALYCLLIKKTGKKYKLPFGPFACLGYLSVLVFQVF